MTYIFSAIFFSLGVAIGISFTVWVFGKMADAGQLVFKSDGEWTGEPAAFAEIAKRVIHE